MIQPFFGRVSTTITSATVVTNLFGGNSASTTTGFGQDVIGADCDVQNPRIRLSASPGVGTSYIFTLQKNNVDTAIVITIADAATVGSDTTNVVTFAAGDKIRWRVSVTGSPGGSAINEIYIEFDNAVDKTCQYPTGGLTNNSIQPRWTNPLSGGSLQSTGSPAGLTARFPCSGTITKLYFYLASGTAVAGSFSMVLYKNGVKQDGTGGTVDTTVTTSTAGAGESINSSTFSLPVSAGDTIYAESSRASGSSRTGAITLVFVADNTNEIPISTPAINLGTAAVTAFAPILALDALAVGSEAPVTLPIRDIIISKLYVDLTAAPSAGKSRVFTMRKSGADQSLTTTISDAATSGNDLSNSVNYSAGDTISCKCVTTSASTTAASGIINFLISLGSAMRSSFFASFE